MTQAIHEEPVPTDAASVNASAAAWLRRRQFWDWTEEDQVGLDAWLAESAAHRVAFWRLNAAWSRTDRLAALRRETGETVVGQSKKRFRLIAAAAIALAIVTVAGAGFWFLRPAEKTYITALGGKQAIMFADGSKVELNTNTALRVNFRQRMVWLDRGEAYFQIKHDSRHPFVVMAGSGRVTDIGTRFVVRRDPSRLKVALVEGQAQFDRLNVSSETPKSLLPGDVVIATPTSTTLLREPAKDLSSELGWRKGVLVFEHATLLDAATEFNRYNSEKIIVADAAAAHLTINGTFRTNDVDAFADAAHGVFGLRVETRNGEAIISR
jgi:transmembrane sensor